MFRKAGAPDATRQSDGVKARIDEISRFVSEINELKNPFVYGVLFGEADHPDIPVHIVPQFSQKGEDVIVASIVRGIRQTLGRANAPLTYLEIGANHPVAASSTFLFYANGARGTLVEPNPRLIPQLKASRPGDRIIEAAVVPGDEEEVQLHIANRSELSSMNSQMISTFSGAEVVESISVKAMRANEVIAEMWEPSSIAFLSVDVEGLDFAILKTVDFDRYPFDIIQVEASDHVIPGNAIAITAYLRDRGYQFVGETEVNLIFASAKSLGIQPFEDAIGDESLAGYGVLQCDDGFNSFDLFDTLIARRGVEPTSAVEKLRDRFPDLVDARLRADDGSMLLPEIYAKAGLPAEMLEEELRLELEESIPIVENIKRLKDGDLVISDTYLPAPFLRELMAKAGISERVGLYASNLDKYHGHAWGNLPEFPALHVGDNERSDVSIPTGLGIKTEYYGGGRLTDWERSIGGGTSTMGRLLREVRLASDFRHFPTWRRLQIEANIPMLLASTVLISGLERRPVFLGRDCQMLGRIHGSLFGNGVYLPFSREFSTDVEVALKYLSENTVEDDLIIDLVSTGRTWSRLNAERDVRVLIESDNYSYGDSHQPPKRFSSFFRMTELGGSTFIWEVLNCANHGMIKNARNLEWGWSRFARPELPKAFVQAMHGTIETCLGVVGNYDLNELVLDPGEMFVRAHRRMMEIVDENPMVFNPIRLAENSNIHRLANGDSVV